MSRECIGGFFDSKYESYVRDLHESERLSKRSSPAYRLITKEGWSNLRTQTNIFFSSLSSTSQTKLRRKRNDLENISQTMNEIKVGRHLASLGFKVEYEQDLCGTTPDWIAEWPDNEQLFVVEVFSKRDSDYKNLEQEYLHDLREKVKSIKIGALLSVRLYKSKESFEWSEKLVETISEKIAKWLSEKPQESQQISINGVEIEYSGKLEKIDHVQLLTISGAFCVNPEPVSAMIKTKLAKYSSVCVNQGIPFVAACCPSFSTGINEDEFDDICPELFDTNHELASVLAFVEDRVKVFINQNSVYRECTESLLNK